MKKFLILLLVIFLTSCTSLNQTQETTETLQEETSSEEQSEIIEEEISFQEEERENESSLFCTEEQMDECDRECGITNSDEDIDSEKESCFEDCVQAIPCRDPLAEEEDEGDNPCNFQESTERDFTEEAQVLGNDAIVNLEVIQVADGSYKMFYHTSNEIFSATSSDGKTFTLDNDRILEGKMPATVQLSDGTYRMYYSDDDSNLMSATSQDGIKFTKESGIRLEKGSALDAYGILHPSILFLSDGSYKLYYDGQSTSTTEPSSWQILSASSEDGVTWIKDAGLKSGKLKIIYEGSRVTVSKAARIDLE